MTGEHPMSDSIAWAKPEDVGMSRERLARIGERLGADIEAGLLPGAVTLVARHGRVVHFKTHGVQDPATGREMARDAIFRIYSMTKPIVSVALMMLVEEGRLTIADPLSAFVPGFADVEVLEDGTRRPLTRPVTIQDLLRHTSGLIYEWVETDPVSRLYTEAKVGRRSRSNAEQADVLATLPLAVQPGTRWDYGRSVDILGRVIEVVGGRTLGEHLARHVFEPLGMLETAFHVPEAFHARIAEPFPTDPETGEPVALLDLRQPTAQENGGGGLASTAPDYARFLHMLASGGVLDGTRLLSPRTIAYMTADHLGPEILIPPGNLLSDGYGFGLGFAVRRVTGVTPYPGSAGDYFWTGLGGTHFWVDPAQGLYALFMAQAPSRREHYRRVMRQLVYGAIVE